jgi:hypothetical protein
MKSQVGLLGVRKDATLPVWIVNFMLEEGVDQAVPLERGFPHKTWPASAAWSWII